MNRNAYRSVAFLFAAVMTIATFKGIDAMAVSADLPLVVMPDIEVIVSTPAQVTFNDR